MNKRNVDNMLDQKSFNDVKRKEIKSLLLDVNSDYDNLEGEVTGSTDIPSISKLIQTPPPPPMGNGKLISFSITKDVLLEDVLIELGRVSDIDIQIDPEIKSSIILKVTEKPLNLVIEKICETADLKYEYKDEILKIERDLPYIVDYNVDILLEHELWSTIENSIKYILDISELKNKNMDQQTTNINTSDKKDNKNTVENQNSKNNNANNSINKINVNKAAGIISVYANNKTQKIVQNFIEQAKRNYGAQVLIEAKVVEVKLNDSYKAGINWNLTKPLTLKGSSDSSGTGADGETLQDAVKTVFEMGTLGGATSGLKTLVFSKKIASKDLNVMIDAMQEFGDTKTLSSPRISSLNNQTATLDFISTIIYFKIEKEEETTTSTSTTDKNTTYTSEKQEEEVGVKLKITPAINVDKNEITLTVEPTLKVLTGYVIDPTESKNRVPETEKREIKTSLKIKSGEVMVIGGLMSENHDKTTNGVPILMNIPLLGKLFKYKSDTKELTETVIFIKATIIDRNNPMGNKDTKFYNNFVKNKN